MDRAERLAAWLERTGLVEHLAEAGLPTVHRDAAGRAVWVDPGTGGPLADDGLAELDRLLHQQGSDPRHAVPVPLLQLARRARQRERLLASAWHTYASLARLRGASEAATRYAVHRAADDRRLLLVTDATGVLMVPAFQLDDDGRPRAELTAVLEPLLAARMDPWQAWGWLTEPAALLGGAVPEHAAADPAEHPLVLHAAVRLAERVVPRT